MAIDPNVVYALPTDVNLRTVDDFFLYLANKGTIPTGATAVEQAMSLKINVTQDALSWLYTQINTDKADGVTSDEFYVWVNANFPKLFEKFNVSQLGLEEFGNEEKSGLHVTLESFWDFFMKADQNDGAVASDEMAKLFEGLNKEKWDSSKMIKGSSEGSWGSDGDYDLDIDKLMDPWTKGPDLSGSGDSDNEDDEDDGDDNSNSNSNSRTVSIPRLSDYFW